MVLESQGSGAALSELGNAIYAFGRTQCAVYKTDPGRIQRDANVAERATRDHVGRWLFELLQNSDDATASQVRILVSNNTVYVADNGIGLKPEAVSAICGTDFSDKISGTIGRKGVGFKSVYEISPNPQVLTVNEEGIEFSRSKTSEWLKQNDFDETYLPYQWIPFLVSWDDAQRQDEVLRTLTDYKTVVVLRDVSCEQQQKVAQLLEQWPPYALFAFRHVRQISALDRVIALAPSDNIWELEDSREGTPKSWRVAKFTEKNVPEELLSPLGLDEQRAIRDDGVSILIAAPSGDDCILPTEEYFPVHVFYPTEQTGPVRLLLHAEFLVKSDRTALVPIAESPFNSWVSERLAFQVCKFVNDAYRMKSPSDHVALLVPFDDRSSHPVADELWHHIAENAKAHLRLANVHNEKRLSIDDALMISVSVCPDAARRILEATGIRMQLLHSSFDEDKEARKALSELGCEAIRDRDLLKSIEENAVSRAVDSEWVWACWEWVAAWAGNEPYGDKHKERVEAIRHLPIVPIGSQLLTPSDLTGRIVTWRADSQPQNLPEWLPLMFVADWFQKRIELASDPENPFKKLCRDLEIKEPGRDIIQRAVRQAIDRYWKEKQGDPGRFLYFILDQDWHETLDVSSHALQRCPVPLSRAVGADEWSEAGKSYFGREWGNELLADLCGGIDTVAWIGKDNAENGEGKCRQILEWLGVKNCLRVVEEAGEMPVWQLPEHCNGWKQYLSSACDCSGRSVEQIERITGLELLPIDCLSREKVICLLRLLAECWEPNYGNVKEVIAKGTQYREHYYRSWQVKAKWWWEVCERIPAPRRDNGTEHVALKDLWLPDKRTERTIGELLPVIDVEAFGSDKDTGRNWLINVVGLRTRMEQLTAEDWKILLSTRIPEKAPAESLMSNERLRDKVTGWYAACIETGAEQDDVTEKVFASCPLLCRKGELWRYVADQQRYLDDDNDIAKAFAEDIWLFHGPARLTAYAEKYLGVLPLSKSVRVLVTPGEPKSPLPDELLARFNAALPYVWAWRASQSKQAAEELATRLKEVRVCIVPTLKAQLVLNGVCHEVDWRWHVKDAAIFLQKDHANEAELAQTLAKAVGAKSEADFYENLFRCETNTQMEEKLLSKGLACAEVRRCLREYSGQSEAIEEPPKYPPVSTIERSRADQPAYPPSTPPKDAEGVPPKGESPDAPPGPCQEVSVIVVLGSSLV